MQTLLPNLRPGQAVGPYQIVGQVGQGGMATVYKAYHPAMDRFVALKILPPALVAQSTEFSARFRLEARTIGKLEHPNILAVYDYGEADGLTYLVMRYLDGGTLQARMAQRLTLAQVDRYFAQLADALGYAHAQGVLHRDVKPANVLLDARDTVFLTDFGLAKILQEGTRITKTDTFMGTPQYMSPEQARAVMLDQRSDLYSLGVLLYEMVTGRVPFQAETPLAVAIMHITDPLPPPSTVDASVPPAIEKVLLKALMKDPAARFQSAEEFLAAWRAARAAGPATVTEGATERSDERVAGATPATLSEGLSANLQVSGKTLDALLSQGGEAMASGASASAVIGAPSGGASVPPVVGTAGGDAGATAGIPQVAVVAGRRGPSPRGMALIGGVLGLCLCLCCLAASANQAGRNLSATATHAAEGNVTATRFSAEVGLTPSVTPVGGGTPVWSVEPWRNNPGVVAVVDGTLYSGGPDGVTRWNLETGEAEHLGLPTELRGQTVVDILGTHDGRFFVATRQGLAQYDPTAEGERRWTVYGSDMGVAAIDVDALAWNPAAGDIMVALWNSACPECGLLIQRQGRFEPFAVTPPMQEHPDATHVSYRPTTLVYGVDGDVWLGTREGLAQYDGAKRTWQVYRAENSALPDNFILAMMLDRENKVWVSTETGTVRITARGEFESVAGLADERFEALWQAADGKIWLAPGGAGQWVKRYDLETGLIETFDVPQIPSGNKRDIAEGADGTLWFAAPPFGLMGYSPDGIRTLAEENQPTLVHPEALFEVPSGEIVLRRDTEVEVWAPDTGQWARPLVNGQPCCGFVVLAVTGDGMVVGSRGGPDGVLIADKSGAVVARLTPADTLPENGARAAAVAPDGTVWLATEAGVAQWTQVGEDWTVVWHRAPDELPSDAVNTVFVGQSGILWVALEGATVTRTSDGRWHVVESVVALRQFAQTADGTMWAVGADDRLYRFDGAQWTVQSEANVHVIAAGADPRYSGGGPGTLWVASYYEGVRQFAAGAWREYTQAHGDLQSDTIYAIYVATDGTVWCVTEVGVERYGLTR